MKIDLKYSFLVLFFSLFIGVCSVNASVVETKEVSSVIANGTTIFDINSGLNTYKMVATGNSTYLRYEINLLSNSPLNESYFLVTQVCSNYGWEGVTSSSNVINVNGRMTYVKTLYTNYNAGSCTVNGYAGTIVQNIYLFNAQASSSVSGSSHIMSATLTTWHGGFTSYNGFIQVLSATIQDYDSNLEQQIINNNNQSSIINQNGNIINQNQTIIEQNNETNDKLDEIKDMDISDADKELPDDTQFNNYQDAEDDLMDKVTQADMSVLDVAIDAESSNFVWDTLTELIQSHTLIFSSIIAILSIGIIKLALGR